MADLHKLAILLQELEEQMQVCMRCGMCQSVCPLYAETGREADVARGKIVLLEHLSRELLKDPQGVKERLDKCLLCGSCAAACPSGVNVLELFLKARALINGYLGLPPARKTLFRFILKRPTLFNSLIFVASRVQGMFTRQTSDIIGSSCARFESALLKDRHFAPLAKTPWHRQMPEMDEPAGKNDLKVAFFPGCLVDKVFPGVAESVHKALTHHGIKIYMPAKQVCCGIPALSAGDLQAFMQLVRQNLAHFSGENYQFLVTPCATCTATIKEIWPMMAEYFLPAEQEQIRRIAGRTMDITGFLGDRIIPPQAAGTDGPHPGVTYHDPCHLKKTLGVHTQPRALVRANPAYEFTEMAEADHCCGMGGSFGLQHYDLSKKVGARKLQNILQSEADVVSTACPACMMQIIDLLSRHNAPIRVKHAVEIYAESLPE